MVVVGYTTGKDIADLTEQGGEIYLSRTGNNTLFVDHLRPPTIVCL